MFYVGAWYWTDQHVSQAILKVQHLQFYMVRSNVKSNTWEFCVNSILHYLQAM